MRLAIAVTAALLWFGGVASAQGPQCRTSPVGASTQFCASEAFVTASSAANQTTIAGVGGAITLATTLEMTGSQLGLVVPVLVASGGTGSTTASGARINLAMPSAQFETITGPTTRTVTAADVNKTFFANAGPGGVTVALPSPATFGLGQITLKKIDTTSNLVQFAGTLEQGQSDLPLSLEGDAATIASDGSVWKLVSPGLATLRHNPIVAEHTVTVTSYNIDKTYNGYIMLADAATAGGPILMILPSLNVAAFSHQTYTVCALKFDASADVVSIVPNGADPGTLHWPSASLDLPNQYDTACVWTDGARWVVLVKP